MSKSEVSSGQTPGGKRRQRATGDETRYPSRQHGTEVISVTVPRGLVHEARTRTGKRGFSAFVSRAIQNELVRENQNELIETIVAERGPLDEERMRSMDRLLGGS